MPDLITNSEASYIQLAVTLGTNPQLRQRYRQEIQQKMQANPACFDSVAYSGAIAQLFQQLFGKWQTDHQATSRILQDSIPKVADLGDRLLNTANNHPGKQVFASSTRNCPARQNSIVANK